MSLRFTKLLFSPDTIAGTGAPLTTELGKDDIFDLLADDKPEVIDLSTEKPDKGITKEAKAPKDVSEEDTDKDEIKEPETEEEEDELKLLEEELAEPDDEKLDLITPVARREILAKYPNVFKDFPYLEKAYYREQQFTEIHPTIEEAQISRDKSIALDAFETDLMDGNIEKMLKAAKTDEVAFAKLADNYLPTLAKIDERAYHNVLGNVLKHTIMQMVEEAGAQNNDVLQNAAAILNQFAFGSSKFSPPTQLSTSTTNKSDPRKDELDKREQKIYQQMYDRASNEITTRVNNTLKATIEQNIDPKQSMNDYVRRNAVRDATETLHNLISKDTRFKNILDKLWESAKKNDYNKNSLDAIRSAHVSRAKTLLPSVIKKARNEALKGMGKRVVEDTEDNNENRVEKPQRTSERPPSNRNSGNHGKISEGESTLDYFLRD